MSAYESRASRDSLKRATPPEFATPPKEPTSAKRSWKQMLRGHFPPSKARLAAEARWRRQHLDSRLPPFALHGAWAEFRAEIRAQRDRDALIRYTTKSKNARIAALQAECDDLKLFVAAILRVLVARGIATESEVLDLVDAIDAEDGALDGKNDDALPRRKPRKVTP